MTELTRGQIIVASDSDRCPTCNSNWHLTWGPGQWRCWCGRIYVQSLAWEQLTAAAAPTRWQRLTAWFRRPTHEATTGTGTP